MMGTGLLRHGTQVQTVVALVWLVIPAIASDECTFTEVGVLENIKRVASAHPGASVDSDSLRASWKLDAETVEYFEAGGCHDYGEKAGRATRMVKARDVDAVLEVAIELAREFMTEQDQQRVIEAINSGAFEKVAANGAEARLIEHPLGEIVVSHSYAAETDTVEIAWPVY